MLKYYKKFYNKEERTEITYDEALNIMLGTWKDNDMTRDMLSIPNRIQCMFSKITVEETTDDGMTMGLMAGLCNMLPMDVEYNDEGNRI